MKTFTSSPLFTAANNIVPKRNSIKNKKDYEDFIKWLDTSNKELKKVKLPSKKKVETLASNLSFDIASSSGGGGGINFGDILKNLAIGGAEGLGIRALLKRFRGGKPTAKIAEEGENIFSKVAKVGQKAEPAGVKAANKIVDFDRKALGKGAAEVGTKEGGKIATQAAEKGAAEVGAKTGGKLVSRALPVIGAVFSTASAIDDIKQGNWAGAGLNAVSAIADLFGQSEISLATAAGAIGTELTYKGDKKDQTPKNKIDERLKEQEKKQREAASRRVTFPDVIDKFDKVVSKFEKFAGGMGSAIAGKQPATAGQDDSGENYDPANADPINTETQNDPTGKDLPEVDATGGEVPGKPDSPFGQPRGNHIHKGNDYFKPSGTPISVIQSGTVTVADMNYDPGGWGSLIEIRHEDGSLSRYAHMRRHLVSAGQKINPGQVIGETGGGANDAGRGDAEGPHLHFEYLPPGSKSQVDPTEAAKNLFRFGGNVKVTAKKGQQAQQDNKVNTITKQQSIEDFIKGTKEGDRILKDPKLKAQLTGQKYQFKGSMVKTPVTDPEVKQAQQMYNAYVRDIRSRQKAKVIPSATTPAMPQALMEDTSATAGSTTMIMQQPSAAPASQPQVVPFPVGGGGGGAVVIPPPSEGQILNSLWKTMLLTNLSSA